MNAILYMLFFQVDICLNPPNPCIFCVRGYHNVNLPLIPTLPLRPWVSQCQSVSHIRASSAPQGITTKKHSPSQGCAFLILSLFFIFFPVVVELDQSDSASGAGLLI